MTIKNRIISAAVSVALVLPFMAADILADGVKTLQNFVSRQDYATASFTDVGEGDWFYDNVRNVYDLGLMVGKGDSLFDANGSIKLSETIAVAARIHAIYQSGSDRFETSDPWYAAYVDYAAENGLIDGQADDYSAPATREQFAEILSRALPEDELEAINDIADGAVPDVTSNDAVYLLYRAGVLTGNDNKGTFGAKTNIKRSEVAAVVSRMVDKSLRVEFTLSAQADPEPVTDDVVYGENGEKLSETTRNNMGQITKVTEYDKNGEVKSIVTYSYSEDGKLSGELHYDSENFLVKRVKYEGGKIVGWDEYEYDFMLQASVELIKSYDSDGRMTEWTKLYSTAKGQILREEMHRPDDTPKEARRYDDESGALLFVQYFDEKGVMNRFLEYSYSDDGGEIDGWNDIEIAQNGLPIVSNEYRADGSKVESVKYDNVGRRLLAMYFDENDALTGWSEYEYSIVDGAEEMTETVYDADGNVVEG